MAGVHPVEGVQGGWLGLSGERGLAESLDEGRADACSQDTLLCWAGNLFISDHTCTPDILTSILWSVEIGFFFA